MKESKKEHIRFINNGFCPVCGKYIIPFGSGSYDIHHGGIHNTKGNRENYPELINSYCNLIPMHAECHANNPGFGRLPEKSIVKLENLLRQFRDVIKTVEVKPKLIIEDFERIIQEER